MRERKILRDIVDLYRGLYRMESRQFDGGCAQILGICAIGFGSRPRVCSRYLIILTQNHRDQFIDNFELSCGVGKQFICRPRRERTILQPRSSPGNHCWSRARMWRALSNVINNSSSLDVDGLLQEDGFSKISAVLSRHFSALSR